MSPRKRLRATQACDFCSKRSIRCGPGTEDPSKCQSCFDFDIQCTYNRPTRRRGPKSRKDSNASQNGCESRFRTLSIKQARELGTEDDWQGHSPSKAWRAFATVSEDTIRELLEIYLDWVYPVFPWFDASTLMQRFSKREHLSDQAFFAALMATCALVATQLRDGATPPKKISSELSPDVFADAAKDVMPKDLTSAKGTDFLRAAAILTLFYTQKGQTSQMRFYYGVYLTLASLENLESEESWLPFHDVEKEERRTIFWSMYCFDIYSSIVWGGAIRHRESQSQVQYPFSLDAAQRTLTGTTRSTSWIIGWSFTVDLYRILEHALDTYRSGQPHMKRVLPLQSLLVPTTVKLEALKALYAELPKELKQFPNLNPDNKMFGVQATNIQSLLALVRMVMFASNKEASIHLKCDAVTELLQVFKQLPMKYMKEAGFPLNHHLAGIASILASSWTGEDSLPQTTFERLISLLQEIETVLEALEGGLETSPGTCNKVKELISDLEKIRNPSASSTLQSPCAGDPSQSGDSAALSGGNSFDLDGWQYPASNFPEWA